MLASAVLLHNPLLLPLHRHRSARRFAVRSSSAPDLVERSAEAVEERRPVIQPYDLAPLPAIKVAKRVVLVRHGQSSWNAEGRIQGSSDFAVLTEKGEAQAETSRQMLIDDSFDVCFSRLMVLSLLVLNVLSVLGADWSSCLIHCTSGVLFSFIRVDDSPLDYLASNFLMLR